MKRGNVASAKLSVVVPEGKLPAIDPADPTGRWDRSPSPLTCTYKNAIAPGGGLRLDQIRALRGGDDSPS
jgi:hypothetical protein